MTMLSPAAQKPTKFTEINPGSQIEITSSDGTYEPYKATVLEVRAEYGPHRIPAIVFKREGGDSGIIMADGSSRVKVLLDSKQLQSAAPPPGALRVRTLPREFMAAQFTGGVDSAMAIITFAAGRANIQWEQPTDQNLEALLMSTLGREDRIEVGDFVLVGETGVVISPRDEVASQYEVIE